MPRRQHLEISCLSGNRFSGVFMDMAERFAAGDESRRRLESRGPCLSVRFDSPPWRRSGTKTGLALHGDGHIFALCLGLLVNLPLNEGNDFLRNVEHLLELILGCGQRGLEFEHIGSRAAELRE